ncbi:MAG TPA: HAMP domain-containing sensor histidine kinase, partial [Alkalispirochaeta sp.]|nr:HAMP domain-containing sensor histidine kinase [Alkalispirochaeta sp.]
MTRSLGTLWTRAILGTVAAAVVVFALALWITLGPLVYRWQQEAGARVHDRYGEALYRLVAITGDLNRRDVRDLLEPEAADGTLSIVWDATGYPMYWSLDQSTHALLPPSLPHDVRLPQLLELYETVGGTRINGIQVDAGRFPGTNDSSAEDVPTTIIEAYQAEGLVTPIRVGDSGDSRQEPVGYFVAGATSYGPDSPTGGVIRALLTAVMAAVAVTAGVAASLIARGSIQVNTAMSAVLAQLEGLSRVNRERDGDVHDPNSGVREFDRVASQITAIGAQLDQERALRHRWAQDIAHDLRTPVAAMRAQLEGMIDGVFERDNARLERLARNLTRLESLAQSFLLLTKIESPDFPVRREPVDLRALLEEITGEFTDRAVAASQPITYSLDTTLPPVVAADEGLVVRALHNLLDNAFVHGSPGPVVISVVRGDAHEDDGTPGVHLSVTNAGTLDEAIAENPFDRFAR